MSNKGIQIKNLRTQLERQKGQQLQIEKTIAETDRAVKGKRRDLQRHEKAREIIREVGIK